jgi:hypothetical protein
MPLNPIQSTSLLNLVLLDLALNLALLKPLHLLARHLTLLPVVLVLTLSILVRRRSSRSSRSRGNRLPQVRKDSSRHDLLLLLPVPGSRGLDRRLRRGRRGPRLGSSSGFDSGPGGGGSGPGSLRSGSSGGSGCGSLALPGGATADWCGWVCGCVAGETEGGGVEVAELLVVVLAVSRGG